MKVLPKYFTSAMTVDNVIFGFDQGDLKVLLVKRMEEPHLGEWGLPGDFVQPEENLTDAPVRVLSELTGLSNVYLEQVSTFGAVNRHPSGRVITIAYYSLINLTNSRFKRHIKKDVTKWVNIRDLKPLPFDHTQIILSCIERLKLHVRRKPIGFELLPPKFTLSELQSLYEAVLNRDLDKRNFRKKIMGMHILVDIAEYQEGVAHRPAKLYQFDKEKYEEFQSEGFVFEI